jgi:membrane protease YdiL (CAAX protease family)
MEGAQHMNWMIISGMLSLVLAMGFGVVAIRHWRAQRINVVDGLGLRWDRNALLDLAAGFLIAAIAMAGIFSTELLGSSIANTPAASAAAPLLWKAALTMMTAAFAEELLNRALLLSGLMVTLGGRPAMAVVLCSLVFGLLHLANHNATALSVVGNTLGGMIYALAFVLSKRLWLPIGLHFGWNFVQGPLLGFPVSGFDMGGLQHINEIGPAWLTGGAYGPEAGLVGIVFRFVIIALMLLWIGWRRNSTARVAPPALAL